MAYQGLFTQGPSVDDLLEQRNKRATDLQQQLMTNAARGARDPAKAQAVSFLGSALGRALSGAVGGEDNQLAKRKADIAEQERLQGEFGQEYTAGTPESNIEMGGKLIKLGYVQEGQQLLERGEASFKIKQTELKNQKRREGLIAQAKKLDLNSTVELLNSGGDMDEAADQIRSQEEIKIADVKGRNGKLLLASKYNKGPEFIQEIRDGKYDSMDSTLFVDALKGIEADLKPFKDAEGKTKFFKVDGSGKVYDPNAKQWVEASSLELTMAPQLTQEVEQLSDYITKTLIDTELTTYGEVHTKATDAQRLLSLNYVSQGMLEQGLVTGKFGEFSLGARKVLSSLGLATEEQDELIGNTEAFFKFRGRAVAEIIKAFGAGTGLSDKDREYAEGIAGGSIVLEEISIAKLLELERTYAYMAIDANNDVVDRLVKVSGDDGWKRAGDFYLEAPVRPEETIDSSTTVVPTTLVLSPQAQAIIDSIE